MSNITRYRIGRAHLATDAAYSAQVLTLLEARAPAADPRHPILVIGSGDTPEAAYQSAVQTIDGQCGPDGAYFHYGRLPKHAGVRVHEHQRPLTATEAQTRQYYVPIRYALA